MRARVVPLLAVCAVLLGCSDDDPSPSAAPQATAGDDSAGSDEAASGDSTAADQSTNVAPAHVDVVIEPGLATDGFVGAREDVEVERCELDGDQWVASGSVTNSSGRDAEYRIYVAFNPADSATARGLVQIDLAVPDGETDSWDAAAAIIDEGLECILRVERVGD